MATIQPEEEEIPERKSFRQGLSEFGGNLKNAGRKVKSGFQNIPNSLGLDAMSAWIQRSLYSKTSNRGALFAEWESKRRTASISFVALAIAGLLAALGYFFLSTDEMINHRPWNVIGGFLKYTTLIMYILSIAAWFNLYTIKTRLHSLTAFKDEEINSVGFSSRLAASGFYPSQWYRAGILKEAFMDLIILLPQPLPFADFRIEIYDYAYRVPHTYNINWILTMIMFARVIFIPRTLADSSHLCSFQARAIGNLNYIGISPGFVLRAYLGRSVTAVIAFFLFLITCFSFMMLIAEHPNEGRLRHNFPNCVWLICMTMTTVGYGDLYPETQLGRMVAVLAAFSAVISTALFVGVVGQQLTLSRQEESVVSVIERMERSKDLRYTAAACISRMWKAYSHRCKQLKDKVVDEKSPLTGDKDRRQPITFTRDVAQAVTEFRDLRRDYISDLVELNNSTMIPKIQFQLSVQLNKISAKVEEQGDRITVLEQNIERQFAALLAAIQKR